MNLLAGFTRTTTPLHHYRNYKQTRRHQTLLFPSLIYLLTTAPHSTLSMETPSSKSTITNVRIVSYNILSSELASSLHFTKCDPEDLETNARLDKILKRLENEIAIDGQTIFCLQEVSYTWASQLHSFFANRSYHLITGLYGKKFNGYMGVALAYPTTTYQTLLTDVSRLSDCRNKEEPWPRPPPDERGILTRFVASGGVLARSLWGGSVGSFLEVFLGSGRRKQDDVVDHWKVSENRFNVLLFVRLKDKLSGAVFCVANYHMPCAFYAPMIMTIHAEMAVRRVQDLAKGDPHIFGGDFNILPDSSTYELITTGKLNEDDATYPTPKWGTEWKSNIKGMRSAYKVIGKEPDFTNYAQIRDDEPFIGTLDYIFISDEWNVASVLEIPNRDQVKGPLPNFEEPSDHVPIVANLQIQSQE